MNKNPTAQQAEKINALTKSIISTARDIDPEAADFNPDDASDTLEGYSYSAKATQDKSAHTPGPWFQDPTDDVGWWLIGTRERPIATIERSDNDVEEHGNAELIASAPSI